MTSFISISLPAPLPLPFSEPNSTVSGGVSSTITVHKTRTSTVFETTSSSPSSSLSPVTTLSSTPSPRLVSSTTVLSHDTITVTSVDPSITIVSTTTSETVTTTSIWTDRPTASTYPLGFVSGHLTKAAVAAIATTISVVACMMVVWGILIHRRRRKQKGREGEVTTAARIIYTPTLSSVNLYRPSVDQPQRTFEDGSPFSSALRRDIESKGNPNSAGYSPPASHEGVLLVDSKPSSPPRLAHSLLLADGHSELNGNGSSSHSHDSIHSREPLITSNPRHGAPSSYPGLNGSFQRCAPSRRVSEESCVPPVPPHIRMSFATPQQLESASPQNVSSKTDDVDDAELPSPLDPVLLRSRFDSGNASMGSFGLRDNEDYSAYPKLAICNHTSSQRTSMSSL